MKIYPNNYIKINNIEYNIFIGLFCGCLICISIFVLFIIFISIIIEKDNSLSY